MDRTTLALFFIIPLFAGCVGDTPDEEPQVIGTPLDAPSGFSFPAWQAAEYDVLWRGVVVGHLGVRLDATDGLHATFEYVVRGTIEMGTAEYEPGSGRLLALRIESRQSDAVLTDMDRFWPEPEEGLIPTIDAALSIADILPLGPRWFAAGWNPLSFDTLAADSEGWMWQGSVDCRTFCDGPDGPVRSYQVRSQGRGILPDRLEVTSLPTNQTASLELVDGAISDEVVAGHFGFRPEAPVVREECPVVPCDAPAVGLFPEAGWIALQEHPLWNSWASAHPGWRLLQGTVGRSGGDLDGVLHTWKFLAGRPGEDAASFELRAVDAGGRSVVPVLVGHDPSSRAWDEAWDGVEPASEWPALDAMVPLWQDHVQRAPSSQVSFSFLYLGPHVVPSQGHRPVLSLSWVDPEGRTAVLNGYPERGYPVTAVLCCD